MKSSIAFGLMALFLVAAASLARVAAVPESAADETISGTISATRTITQNARLTGDVTCTVAGAPCLQFGASGITLDLAGFTITGSGVPATGCQGGNTTGEDGIFSSGQSDVTIQGPGSVQRFRGSGILVSNTNRSRVVNVTSATNCLSGIYLLNTSDSHVEGNVSIRNGTSSANCGGLWINGASRGNRVLRNQISGNGYVRPAGPNFGIGLLAGGGNLIEENVVTGNVTGMRILAASVGNIIRGNVIAGNPPIQLANSVPDDFGVDILNLSTAGANTFENNLCVTSMNAPCTNTKPATIVIPLATGLVFDAARVRLGGAFNATFSGSNLTNATYFDIRFRGPGSTSDQEAWNWQQGPSGSHPVAQSTTVGDWTITGLRAHLDGNDHSGPYAPLQATLSVFVSPFS